MSKKWEEWPRRQLSGCMNPLCCSVLLGCSSLLFNPGSHFSLEWAWGHSLQTALDTGNSSFWLIKAGMAWPHPRKWWQTHLFSLAFCQQGIYSWVRGGEGLLCQEGIYCWLMGCGECEGWEPLQLLGWTVWLFVQQGLIFVCGFQDFCEGQVAESVNFKGKLKNFEGSEVYIDLWKTIR